MKDHHNIGKSLSSFYFIEKYEFIESFNYLNKKTVQKIANSFFLNILGKKL